MEITNVLSAFARLADEGGLEELGNLFTADIEWSMPGATWRGRAEVLSGLGSMRDLGHAGPDSGNRHVITNQEVYVDHDRATARSYFLLLSQGPPAAILAVGSYHDELLREDGQWLIARRQVTT
ncbi:nuclear transport factor 2 family protein [Streptomyces mirabilis]|uniref:nuclear transport factor 2 family protein n=1 Tax=Streptomyces mirabilis TaxID=68239 RepID=UPI00339EF694